MTSWQARQQVGSTTRPESVGEQQWEQWLHVCTRGGSIDSTELRELVQHLVSAEQTELAAQLVDVALPFGGGRPAGVPEPSPALLRQQLLAYCLAYRLELPWGQVSAMAASGVLGNAVRHALLQRRLLELRRRTGRDPRAGFGFLHGGQLGTVWDEPHILKRLMASIQGQGPEGDEAALLNRCIIAAAITKLESSWEGLTQEERDAYSVSPAFLRRVLEKQIDDQNVPAVVAFFGCRQLWEQLAAMGHERTAALLQIVSEAFAAWDESGLTADERTRRLHARTLVVARVLGDTTLSPEASSSSLGGLPAGLLLAMVINAEVRLHLLSQLPEELRALLCERALSSDVVELVFSTIHGRLGNHLDQPTLLGCLGTVAFAAWLASQPEERRGWRMAPTSKSYACHPEEAEASTWNDGTALPGGPRHGAHFRMHAARARRKAGAAEVGGGQRQRQQFHAHMQ